MGESGEAKHISLLALQEAALSAITAIRDQLQRILDQGPSDDLVAVTLRVLTAYMSARSQAVMMLVSWKYPWDAEIVLRSFYECCVKILFITASPPESRQALCEEYWFSFESIHAMRHARKAQYAEEVPGSSQTSIDIFAMLRDPDVWDLTPRANKAKRKEIEQRWSFAEIVEALDSPTFPGRRIVQLKSVLHLYGMASHLIHADKSAMDLMHDRQTRAEPEKSILAAAHAGRIMSDVANFWLLCADVVRQHFGSDFEDGDALVEHLRVVAEHGTPFVQMFEDSQRPFYERLRRERSTSSAADDQETPRGPPRA